LRAGILMRLQIGWLFIPAWWDISHYAIFPLTVRYNPFKSGSGIGIHFGIRTRHNALK